MSFQKCVFVFGVVVYGVHAHTSENPTTLSTQLYDSDNFATCNGLVELIDGSDEYLDNCRGTQRPILGLLLHCSSSWTASHDRVCPEICRDEPEFCYYALIAENGEPNTCQFPRYPANGSYSVQILSGPSERTSTQLMFRLKFFCDPDFELEGADRLMCIDGSWVNKDVPRQCKYQAIKLIQELMIFLNKSKKDVTTVLEGSWINIMKLEQKIQMEMNNTILESNLPETSTSTPTGNCSSGHEWQCDDGACIPAENKCNGLLDCKDSSDEFLHTCRDGPSRPMLWLLLHCTLSWTTSHKYLCPHICRDDQKLCHYALMAENGEPNTCRLPNYPLGGKYQVNLLTGLPDPGVSGRLDFGLSYSCEPLYVLKEEAHGRPQCINGTWHSNFSFCSALCPLNKNANLTYTCILKHNNRTIDCKENVDLGTTVTVSETQLKTDDQHTDSSSIDVICGHNHILNSNLDCEGLAYSFQLLENTAHSKLTEYGVQFSQVPLN